MTTEHPQQTPLFNFPVLLILTAILCLVTYQVFGLNTAVGVSTATAALTWCSLRRKSTKPVSESN
ncbi:MAG: hypothetical protein KDA84_05295 [Planctomycetaceae bacterium]|nr:hypothetical protein [Planctomycetaceae bacterium]